MHGSSSISCANNENLSRIARVSEDKCEDVAATVWFDVRQEKPAMRLSH